MPLMEERLGLNQMTSQQKQQKPEDLTNSKGTMKGRGWRQECRKRKKKK